MLLKRNLLTILYSFIFVIVFGIGFLEVARLAIRETSNYNITACIFVLGIAIYLIVAFFIKEGRYLEFFQKSSIFSNLMEAFFVLFICGTTFFLNMERGLDNAVLIVIMLACMYACSRLLGGRLCGGFALVIGFFFLLSMADSSFDSEEYMKCLCFLIPYAAFLWVTKILVKSFAKKGFILFCSYLFLSVIFALAMAMNPYVCALLIGCVCALIFGASDEEQSSKMTEGPIVAVVFAFLTAGLFLGYQYFLMDLSLFPDFNLDARLFTSGDMRHLIKYCITKYTRTMQYIYRPFTISFFPAVMMLLGCLSGYYAIRKKASAIGPLCFAYIILLAYYMACNELGTHFYYLTFFLPVFTSYGITNTLVSERLPLSGEIVPEQIKQQKEQGFIPEEESVICENPALQPEEKETMSLEKKQINREEPEEREIQEDIALNAEKEGHREAKIIPEWTVPQDYISKANQPETEILNEEYTDAGPSRNEETVSEDEIPLTEPDSATVLLNKKEEETQVMIETLADDGSEKDMIQIEELGSESLSTDIDYKIASPEILETEQVDVSKDSSYMHGLDDLDEDEISENNSDSLIQPQQNDEDTQLDNLLERLDISENIRRMQESATEDMADVIEREEERDELLTAIPADEMNYEAENLVDVSDLEEEEKEDEENSGFHSLPKYVKPDFDFSMEPMSQSLSQNEPVISEYDRVPTINDLERKWRELNESAEVADEMASEEMPKDDGDGQIKLEFEDTPQELEKIQEVPKPEEEVPKLDEPEAPEKQVSKVIHCEEVVKHTPAGKRSYHKITLG